MITVLQMDNLTSEERAMADAAMAVDGAWFTYTTALECLGGEREDAIYIVAAQPANVLRTLAALADARIEAARLREVLEYAASDFENAVDYHTKPKTGMLVPWFSPWANALTPSAIGELRRLAKQFRDALAGGRK
jgi:hypothetical protein